MIQSQDASAVLTGHATLNMHWGRNVIVYDRLLWYSHNPGSDIVGTTYLQPAPDVLRVRR